MISMMKLTSNVSPQVTILQLLLFALASADAALAQPPPLTPDLHLRVHEAKCSLMSQAQLSVRVNGSALFVRQQTKTIARGKSPIADGDCWREPTAWRWLYVSELTSARPLVKESNVDERLANVQYTCQSARVSFNNAFKFASGSRQLDARNEQRVAGARVNDQLCGVHLRAMLEQMDQLGARLAGARRKQAAELDLEEKLIQLAKVLDTFGRYEPGHLSGRSHSVGAYHQCLQGRLLLDAAEQAGESRVNRSSTNGGEIVASVGTRFCWAHMSYGAHLNSALRTRTPNVEMQDLRLSSGICIPETCHTRHFKHHRHLFERLVQSQFRLPKSMYLRETLGVESIFCLVDEDSPYLSTLPASGKLFILVALGWLALVAWASAQTEGQESQAGGSPDRLARCLDVRQCWAEFIEQARRPSCEKRAKRALAVDLDPINPVKVAMCAYVVLGHSAALHTFMAQDQLHAAMQVETDRVSVALLMGTFSVDTFLTITGLLLSWQLLRRLDKLKSVPALQGYAHMTAGIVSARYLRLVPLYFLVFWFKKSLFARLGSGPFWDHGLNRQTALGACHLEESWWTPLVLSASSLPLFKQCLTPSWSISIDIRLCLLVTPVILMAHKHRAAVKLLLLGAWAYSARAGYREIMSMEPAILSGIMDCKSYGTGQLFNKLSYFYTEPKFRICGIAMGALAGILLYEHERRQVERRAGDSGAPVAPFWPESLKRVALGATLAWNTIFFASVLNIQTVIETIAPQHRYIMPNLVAMRCLWCLSGAILFVLMATDWRNRALVRICSLKLWRILAKLNLVVLLLHWDMLVFYQHYQIDTHSLNKWNYFIVFGAVYLFSLALGTLLHIAVESPLDRLVRHYIFGERLEGLTSQADGKLETQVERREEQRDKLE